ncbi:hypothetical protein B0T17DRAFT_541187 [Bombardia bombarda]|uniref:Uncharacterized protein n=1 Tax=Bombardia bombarda TaxID=252184 RepID=A0AA40BVG8_9PEZI|nr:hypothetical protein B0T17DRAFT_541187 [Bombardia bombarda]
MMMELMQGYVKEGANLGLDDPEHWDSDVVNFLSATTSASSANELSKVGLASFCVEPAANLDSAPILTVLAKGKIERAGFSGYDVD